jgi:type II secretory pathway predicted ATPase ExeA
VSELNVRVVGQGPGAGPAPQGSNTQDAKPWLQQLLDHYGLFEQPFGVTPDPRFLYFGPQQREALAALEFGTEARRGSWR